MVLNTGILPGVIVPVFIEFTGFGSLLISEMLSLQELVICVERGFVIFLVLSAKTNI